MPRPRWEASHWRPMSRRALSEAQGLAGSRSLDFGAGVVMPVKVLSATVDVTADVIHFHNGEGSPIKQFLTGDKVLQPGIGCGKVGIGRLRRCIGPVTAVATAEQAQRQDEDGDMKTHIELLIIVMGSG